MSPQFDTAACRIALNRSIAAHFGPHCGVEGKKAEFLGLSEGQ